MTLFQLEDNNKPTIDGVEAFKLGRRAAKAGRGVEQNPFDKGDIRHIRWIEGHRDWRCKETFDLFETMEE